MALHRQLGTERRAQGTAALICLGSSHSGHKCWKALISSMCHWFFTLSFTWLPMVPSPTYTTLLPEHRRMRGVDQEWHWEVLGSTRSPWLTGRSGSLVRKSSTLQPPDSLQPVPLPLHSHLGPARCPGTLCLHGFHHGLEVSSPHPLSFMFPKHQSFKYHFHHFSRVHTTWTIIYSLASFK